MNGDEIFQAFAHPEARAAGSTGSGPIPDRISLRDHVVAVEIGAFQAERGTTQRLAFNVVVEVAPPGRPIEDDVDLILSYDKVTQAIAAELAARRFDLLETLAEGIAARILREPQALRVFLRIEKLDRGPGRLGVEIVRSAPPVTPAAPEGPVPAVLYLDAAGVDHPALGDFLGLVAAAEWPAVLVCDPPDLPRPATDDAQAARQIALLAADQAAWALAGRDSRLSVAATRTELDWAIAGGKPVVWAPARLLRAAITPPPPQGPALAAWLARELAACALIVPPGHTPPPDLPDLPPDLALHFAAPGQRALPNLAPAAIKRP